VRTSWNGLSVLVTGASGFLGSHVAERLARLEARTYGLTRGPSAAEGKIQWIEADLTDSASTCALLREIRPDIVFHLAGRTVVSADRELVLPSFRDNLESTVILLNQLADSGCRRIVITGSLEEPEPAQADCVPASPYAASKWAAVVYARMFHALYQLPVVIVRPYMTYGPRQRPSKLIPSVTLSLLRGQAPTIKQPDREVDWVYVEDVVDGILAAGRAPGVEGSSIDLGSGRLIPIREVAEHLERLVGNGVAVRLSRSERSAGVQGRRADPTAAGQLLGWSPRTPLRKGLEETVAWYRARLPDYDRAD
jgi:nucleoside-diphosphate-sugar epimerase